MPYAYRRLQAAYEPLTPYTTGVPMQDNMRPSLENRHGNPLTDWLISNMQRPHPATQFMPSAIDVGKEIVGSTKRLGERGKGALSGEMYDPGQVTYDMLNFLTLGAPASGLAAKGPAANPVWFSPLRQAVENAPIEKGSGQQWLGTLNKQPGVKPDEIEWTGLEGFLKENPKATKQEVLDHLDANKVEVQEVVKGNKYPEPKQKLMWQGDVGSAQIHDPESVLAAQSAYREGVEAGKAKWTDGDGNPMTTDEAAALAEQWKNFWGNDRVAQPKFSDYQMPGGENYRELLLTLPRKLGRDEIAPSDAAAAPFKAEWDRLSAEIRELQGTHNTEARIAAEPRIAELEAARDSLHAQMVDAEIAGGSRQKVGDNFRGGHYDEPNVLAHVRFNDRTTADGKKTLFVEEIQSDWHQKGRKQGYAVDMPQAAKAEWDQLNGRLDALESANKQYKIGDPEWEANVAEMDRSGARMAELEKQYPKGTVPNAPFKQSREWAELSLKRMIKKAVDEGYDSVSWTPGEVQAARYDLSKQVKSIEWQPHTGRRGTEVSIVRIQPKEGNLIELPIDKDGRVVEGVGTQFDGKVLDEVLGKDMAEKILKERHGDLSGVDLKVGGEGMKGFYDKILPSTANKLLKKLDKSAKVGVTKVWKSREGMLPEDANYEFMGDGTIRVNGRTFANEAEADAFAGSTEAFTQEVWEIPITDKMRAEVGEKGMPLFTSGVPIPSQDNGQDFDALLNELPQILGNQS